MRRIKLNGEFIGFTLISGLISFGYNAVMTVIPLRMTDCGLEMSSIGMVMSALLAIADKLLAFAVLMAALGIFRGIFLAVSGSYVMEMVDESGYGRINGTVQGLSSLLASIGGMVSGLLYPFRQGELALCVCSLLLMGASVWAATGLKSGRILRTERIPVLMILKSINKRIVIFCLLVFIQSFVAGPMWSFIIPMYCYNVLLFSPAALGVLMSMDELVSAPAYMLAGRVVDRVNVVKFNVVFLLLTALGGLFLTGASSVFGFMLVFLLCSISISCTFVGIPKERIGYIRKGQKGFELALISMCGSLGDALGSNVLGKVAAKYTIHQCIYIFSASYVAMAFLAVLPSILKKSHYTATD